MQVMHAPISPARAALCVTDGVAALGNNGRASPAGRRDRQAGPEAGAEAHACTEARTHGRKLVLLLSNASHAPLSHCCAQVCLGASDRSMRHDGLHDLSACRFPSAMFLLRSVWTGCKANERRHQSLLAPSKPTSEGRAQALQAACWPQERGL